MANESAALYFTARIRQTKRQQKGSSKSNRSNSGNSEDNRSDCEFDLAAIKAEFGVKPSKATGRTTAGGGNRTKDDGDEKAYRKRME